MQALDHIMEGFGAPPGAAIVVLRAGQPPWAQARGRASPDGAATTPDHPIRLASVTKSLVAAATLRLVEEGRFRLDDSVGPLLLPETRAQLSGAGQPVDQISVRMLLAHTHGIPDYFGAPGWLEGIRRDPKREWTRKEQTAFGLAAGARQSLPGETFSYADVGYNLLGEVIEQTTGESLGPALRRLLSFDRLGLNATWWEPDEQGRGPAPRAHQIWEGMDTHGFHPSMDGFGAGGLVSSARDLAAMFEAMGAGRMLAQPETLVAMRTPGVSGSYGLGLALRRVGNQDCFGHGGFWGVEVWTCPGIGLTVAGFVLETRAGERLGDAITSILDAEVSADMRDQASSNGTP